jgi:tetratricopeptide (TPR) repeat protein
MKMRLSSIWMLACASAVITAVPTHAAKLIVPRETSAILDKIYSLDTEGATQDAQRMQQERPAHPLGYLLEAEALWWRIWCSSAEFKYGMTYANHRAKFPGDQRYLDLAAKVSALANRALEKHESAEMHFYAGMGDGLSARLYALRWENRNTARAGVHAREHLLRAITIDPEMADADFGLGLYNYYVDTLGSLARMLRFFMGIPSGSKQRGIQQLKHVIAEGTLTSSLAIFYLAISLHRYDHRYAEALEVITPLAAKYPGNPLFQLVRGDLYAKLNRKQQALACYRAAVRAPIPDPECWAHIQQLAKASVEALSDHANMPEH